jgi:hypothetical protein
MKRYFRILPALVTAFCLVGAADAVAQESIGPDAFGSVDDDATRYLPTPPRTETVSLAHQKARIRAEQRMARQAALRWYGFSAARPTASAVPWTTMSSPAWAMPGGRPFGWYYSSRPVVIITSPAISYR